MSLSVNTNLKHQPNKIKINLITPLLHFIQIRHIKVSNPAIAQKLEILI
jgi:hypothetical protein